MVSVCALHSIWLLLGYTVMYVTLLAYECIGAYVSCEHQLGGGLWNDIQVDTCRYQHLMKHCEL